MKRIILFAVVLSIIFGGIARATNSSYPSPDGKKKAVHNCKEAYEKSVCAANNTIQYKTVCTFHMKMNGQSYLITDGYFFDKKKEYAKYHTLFIGKPVWSADSRYFVFLKVGTPLHDSNVTLYDTEKGGVFGKSIISPGSHEGFCAPDKKGDVSYNPEGKIFMHKNSFSICIQDYQSGVDGGFSDGANTTFYDAIMYEFSFEGRQISKRAIKVFEKVEYASEYDSEGN
ncbi:MAG TPA: hypothetical protein P5096_01115 [Patescibacteria group bacterium]|nr:hypothetical protein [Patescibacteria group bacterium]